MSIHSPALSEDFLSRIRESQSGSVSSRGHIAVTLGPAVKGVHTNPAAPQPQADPSLPSLRDYAVRVMQPGRVLGDATRIQGEFVHDAVVLNPGWFSGVDPGQLYPQSGNVPFSVTDHVYLPPDANTMLCVTHRCIRNRYASSSIVASRQRLPQWLNLDAAVLHCAAGIGIWHWASTDYGTEPDVVMACCGDIPTRETLAAVDLLRRFFPALKIRVVNVVNLMMLQSSGQHPRGLSDRFFSTFFPPDKPIIFAFHGYAALIYWLTGLRSDLGELKVLEYREEGPITTPFDKVVRYEIDRFHLVRQVIECLPQLHDCAADARRYIRNWLTTHQRYVAEYGEDLPQIRNWTWGSEL
ncbi:MAG TPA: hypothetical protein VM553_20475 [Dongiaceae bacterium]|nr:hypothetical protein [Dongiaceae bacterium]